MKLNLQLFRNAFIGLALLGGLQAMAVPAKPGLLTVTDADGTQLKVRLVGDESFHQYLTEDGFPLVEEAGLFYYCDYDANGNVINSNIKAANIGDRKAEAANFLRTVDTATLDQKIRVRANRSPRRALAATATTMTRAKAAADLDEPPYERGYGLFPDLRFPAYGKQKSIVILVEYQDVKFQKSYGVDAHDYFKRMLNENNFSDLGGTGSAAQYFREQSDGAFEPEFDVYGPIRLKNNMSYYGGNSGGADRAPEEMVIEACEQLDDIVDFSEYDRNNDGVVDNIFIFYAGRGEATGGGANTVWPHSWSLTAAGHPNVYHDGVRIHTYGCTNEWTGSRPDGVGTFIHEFSHVMGLPDLYATSYTSAFTPGAWSALDLGPYNNNGMTPPNYSAFERYALGWVKPREINKEISGTLQPVIDNVCGVIRTEKDTEFFLIENRQQEGWDAFIPGHGMLVWHVDYDEAVWTANTVNNSPSHQYVDIEEADGTQSEYTRSGDCYPGTAGKSSFTSATTPAMRTWGGKAVNFPITDIVEENGLVKFNVLGGSDEVAPEAPVAEVAQETVGADSFEISWAPLEGFDALVSVYTRPEAGETMARAASDGNKIFVPGYRSHNAGNASSILVEGIEPETTYYYTVTYSQDWLTSLPSEEQSVTTTRKTIDYYSVEVAEAEDVATTEFKATWLPLDEATEYAITVVKKVADTPIEEFNGFDGGVEDMGDWITTAKMTYTLDSYVGESAPSIRLSGDDILETPDFDDFISGFSFWHRGSSTSQGCTLEIYALAGSTTTLIETLDVVREEGGQTTEITNIPEGTTCIRIVFVREADKGVCAIDDVKVLHGMNYKSEPIEEYTDKLVGNALSTVISGLTHDTLYAYSVKATDGNLWSKPSEEMFVRTEFDPNASDAAVAAISGEKLTVSISGTKVKTTAGELIEIFDTTGRKVARGNGEVSLPGAGLYIVSVPEGGFTRKVVVK